MDGPGEGRFEPPDRFPEPVTRLSADQRWLRGLLVLSCLALAWWAVWLIDPRNLPGQALFAVVVAAQVLDLLAVAGFWYTVWPRRSPATLLAPVQGRASVLVLAPS